MLGRLTAARLVTGAQTEDEGPGLELAHESLMHSWARLRRWMEASRGERATLEELRQAAQLWERRGRSEAEVWQVAALLEAERAVEQAGAQVPDVITRFVRAGADRRRRRTRSQRARRLVLVAALLVVAAGSLVAALVMRDQEREARRQAITARQQRAAALRQGAEAEREAARRALAQGDLLEARARIRGSLEMRDSTAARMLWWELTRNPLSWKLRLGESVNHVVQVSDRRLEGPGKGSAVYGVAITPDGRTVAAGGRDRLVRLWDVATGAWSAAFGATAAASSAPDSAGTASAWSPAATIEPCVSGRRPPAARPRC